MRPAIEGILRSPSAWVVAAAGFLARGGILVFALPVLSLPTPVGVTLVIPPLSVTTSGISSEFFSRLVALGAGLLVVVGLALFLGALSDAASFRLMAERAAVRWSHPGTSGMGGSRADVTPSGIDASLERSRITPGLLARLVATELFALLPAIAAGLVTVSRLISVGEQEYLLPTSVDVPYPVRVVQGAAEPVIALAACLLLADVANALISRRVLRGDARRHGGGSPRPQPSSSPVRTEAAGPPLLRRLRGDGLALVRIAVTWAGAWVVTISTVVPGLIAIELAWPGLRDAYTATMSRTPPSPATLVAVTVVFVGAWLAALVVAGLGSAIRTILWSFATEP